VVFPPTALRELEKELKLTLAALGARAEGNAADEAELTKGSAKKDGHIERERTESGGTIGDGFGGKRRTESNATIGDDIIETVLAHDGVGDGGARVLDMDAVVGALGAVGLEGEG